jgi:hypothetical protein
MSGAISQTFPPGRDETAADDSDQTIYLVAGKDFAANLAGEVLFLLTADRSSATIRVVFFSFPRSHFAVPYR